MIERSDFFDILPAPILVVDLENGKKSESIGGLVTRANKAALKLYGADSVEKLSGGFDRILGNGAKDALEKARFFIDSGERAFSIETENRTLDGRALNLFLQVSIPSDESGNRDLSRVMVYPKDITEGRILQRKLQVLSVLPSANPNIVMIMQCINTLIYLNPAGHEFLNSLGLYDQNRIRILLPDNPEESLCRSCDRRERKGWRREIEGRKFDVKLSPLPDRERCMLTAVDVTEFERVSREHEIFYEAFKSVKSAILVTDPKGKIIFVNPWFESLYGISRDQVIGKQPSMLNPGKAAYRELGIDSAEYDALFSDLWKSLLDPAKGYWEGDFYNKNSDGTLVHVRAIMQAIRIRGGELTSFIAFPVDITESEKHERTIRLEIFRTIAGLAELRDNETGNHILRVGGYAKRISEEYSMPNTWCQEIAMFAPLHDIGKVGITDSILLAPRKLSDDEFSIMKRHTTLGWELLKEKSSLEMAADIALSHHERWDGKGYPNGLAGEAIPFSARITAVCDVYDALRSERPYKCAWSHEDSITEIVRNAGSQFDPEVVEKFISCESCISDVFEDLPD